MISFKLGAFNIKMSKVKLEQKRIWYFSFGAAIEVFLLFIFIAIYTLGKL